MPAPGVVVETRVEPPGTDTTCRVHLAVTGGVHRAGLAALLRSTEGVELAESDGGAEVPAWSELEILIADVEALVLTADARAAAARPPRTIAYMASPTLGFFDVALRLGADAILDATVERRQLAQIVDELRQARPTVRMLAHPRATQPQKLTPREHEVRSLACRGWADKQIARELGISVKTVEKHMGSVLRKTGAPNRTTLAAMSLRD